MYEWFNLKSWYGLGSRVHVHVCTHITEYCTRAAAPGYRCYSKAMKDRVVPQLHDVGHHGGGGGENILLSSYSFTPNSLHGAPTHLWGSRRGRESNSHEMNHHCGLSASLLSSFLRYMAQRAAEDPARKAGQAAPLPAGSVHCARPGKSRPAFQRCPRSSGPHLRPLFLVFATQSFPER